ncbi:unnamed protein product, partial [Mesorhabditis belari]|uniref:Uncharacterized protein n=1 Tax=Mesorhabditis belari TaxID=2138241 RepID=A0AAF3ELF8_9BILA
MEFVSLFIDVHIITTIPATMQCLLAKTLFKVSRFYRMYKTYLINIFVVEDPTNQFIPHLEKITIPLKASSAGWEEAEKRIPWGSKHQSNQVGRHSCWKSNLASPVEVLNEAEKCGFVAVMMASTNGGRTTKWTLQKKDKDLHL